MLNNEQYHNQDQSAEEIETKEAEVITQSEMQAMAERASFFTSLYLFFYTFQKKVGLFSDNYPNVEQYCVPGSPGGKPLLDTLIQTETSPIQKNVLIDVSNLFFRGVKYLNDAYLILSEFVQKDAEIQKEISLLNELYPPIQGGKASIMPPTDCEGLIQMIKTFGEALKGDASDFQELVNSVETTLESGQRLLTRKGDFSLMFEQRVIALLIQKIGPGLADVGNAYHLLTAYLQWRD